MKNNMKQKMLMVNTGDLYLNHFDEKGSLSEERPPSFSYALD